MPLATVRLLPADQRAQLTYSIEVDANRRALPAVQTPNRSSTAYNGHFEPLCLAPCEVRFVRGSYLLGIAEAGEKNIPVTSPLVVNRDITVFGHYQSNRWRRGLGIALIVAAVVVGGVVVLGSLAVPCAEDGPCSRSSTPMALGAGILSVGTVSGILLIATGSNSASMVQQ